VSVVRWGSLGIAMTIWLVDTGMPHPPIDF
jgi:hypothetical protein